MTIKTIIGENGPQSEICNGGACPAAIIAVNGDVFVQGYDLEPEEQAALAKPAGESFVRIPLTTLKKIAAQVIES